MNKLSQLLSNEISYAIGWTIIHSLWQCTLIALFIATSYAFTKKASAATRYWINSLGLLSCFIASGITFYLNYYDSVSIEIVSTAYFTEISSSSQPAYVQSISDIINQNINQIAMVWLIGFALYMSKYLAEFFYCQHIKNNHYTNPNQQCQQLFNELKNSVGITQNIQLRLSEIVDIPCVVGHFKPVVLLPASLVLGLSIKQIEVILLHELGHIRRNDYLISSLQTLITLLYFFNPFARWISSKMDEERENACDDIAVAVSGDPLFYANTLKEFAEMKEMYSPAVAMTGRKNLLINRIKRLFIRDTSFTKTYGKAITIMAMFLFTIGYSVAGYSEEKKPTKNTFSIKIENEPLSKLLILADQHCPGTAKKVKLRNPDKIISNKIINFECSTIDFIIQRTDISLDMIGPGLSINAINIALKDILKTAEISCPNIVGKVDLKNPELLTSLISANIPCIAVESVIRKMDGELKLNSDQITQIENSFGNEEYKRIVRENSVYDSEEAVKNQYSAECVATFTVTTQGYPINIAPNCSSNDDNAKAYYNNVMYEGIKKSKFPIKMESGKAVTVENVAIRMSWRVEKADTLNPPTSSTPLHTQEKIEDIPDTKNIKQISIMENTNDNLSLGLSINKDINIRDYNEIEFKPLFFGKKLIDTENKRDYRDTLKEFDFFSREFIALANKNFFASIRNNELAILANSTGSKKLIGEVHIHTITPYWTKKDNFPCTTGAGSTICSGEFPQFFKANIMLGVVLKDAESKEIIAVLKDQFVYSESKTGISYMSEKRKSRFIDEAIISNIKESISKTTNGLIAYSQEKAPSADASSSNEKFVNLNVDRFESPSIGGFDKLKINSKSILLNYGNLVLSPINFSDTEIFSEDSTALKYSTYVFHKENEKYLSSLKKQIINSFNHSKNASSLKLTGKSDLIAELKILDINLYWEKTSTNNSKFETSSEAIKDPNTLNSIGIKTSTTFSHTPINTTELAGDVKMQIRLVDTVTSETVVLAEKTSDIHLGSLAGFTSKADQQNLIIKQIFKPMFNKAFSDLYVSLEKISTQNINNMNGDNSKINAFSTNEIPRNAAVDL